MPDETATQGYGVLFPSAEAVERQDARPHMEVGSDVALDIPSGSVALVIAADLTIGTQVPVGEVDTVLDRGGVPAVLGVAAAGESAEEAERREGA